MTDHAKALAELEELIAKEAFNHAACFSIAKGLPGWEDFECESEATRAVKELKLEAVKLREALAFYADRDNYIRVNEGNVDVIAIAERPFPGHRARKALGGE